MKTENNYTKMTGYLSKWRLPLCFVTSLLLLYGLVLYIRYNNATLTKKEDCAFEEETTKKILIYAQHRTGSSFVSELFRQNRKVFFIFEPLKYDITVKKSFYLNNTSHFVNNILNCQFQELFDKGSHLPQKTISKYKKKSFCSAGFTCPKVSILEEYCSIHLHRAVKIISVNSIAPVLPLINHGLKVIHLIRDPRGVLSSRVKISEAFENPRNYKITGTYIMKKYGWIVKQYCQQIEADFHLLHYILNDSRYEGIRRNYLLLRYEDLAKDPLGKATEIYKYMGMKLPSNVKRWIIQYTTSDDINRDAYSTTRKSNTTFDNWRSYLPFNVVKFTQDECKDVMRYIGYRPARSKKHMLSLKKSLLTNLPENTKHYLNI